VSVVSSIEFTIAFDEPDEDGWIVARVLEVSGALSQGRTREEARENLLDALRTVLTPDDELSGRRSGENLEQRPRYRYRALAGHAHLLSEIGGLSRAVGSDALLANC